MKAIRVYRLFDAAKSCVVGGLWMAAAGFFSCWRVEAAGPVPRIAGITLASNQLALAISNVETGGTYYVESTGNLATPTWAEEGAFEGMSGVTNWYGATDDSAASVFYRVVRDAYHPRVGAVAIFTNYFHGISGTAHIVNNRTIELRNFYYDGGGLDVVAYVSPNWFPSPYPSSYSGTVISGDLRRPSPGYVNETLSFTLPEGFDLDSAVYISIWCIDIPVSFGDGMFQ